MKNIFFLLILSLPLFCSGQNFKEDPDFVKQTPSAKGYMLDTVVASDLSKVQIFSNAVRFLENRFKNNKQVIQTKDLELGEISFKGNAITDVIVSDTSKKGKISSYTTGQRLFFNGRIYVKDKKFKVVLNGLSGVSTLIPSVDGIPIDPYNYDKVINPKEAGDLALSIIKEISTQLNIKPQNEF